MNTNDLEPALMTYMYFLHIENGGEDTLEKFYEFWAGKFYDATDMSTGKFYE